MKTRAVTNGIRVMVCRLLLMTPILLVGMVIACFFRVPGHSVYASLHEAEQAGAELFHKKGCERCHGIDGVGTKKAPDLRTIGKRWKKSQIEKQILDGGFEMPPFQDALERDEVKSLVAYLSAKRKLPKNP
jgi:ubiquinol-cytochrome c reductase cytochrome b subunit